MNSGIINIDKPAGFTSFDVVAVARKYLKIKKIGHTGTLDPQATGVLVLCFGRAARIISQLENDDKEYIAEVILGAETDTQDSGGVVILKSEKKAKANEIENAVSSFKGEISQIPPMYSAVKIDGKKLYDLARRGIEVERKPRQVNIKSIEIFDLDEQNQKLTIKTTVSKGTYIRTLCSDIGQKLGTYAHMGSLRRTRCGKFNIEDSITLDEFKQSIERGNLINYIKQTDFVFEDLEKLYVDEVSEKKVLNGGSINIENNFRGNIRVYSKKGEFLAIYDNQGKCIKNFFEV